MRSMLAHLAVALVMAASVAAAAATPPPGSRYVALGSSYAAGAGIGPLQPGSPPRCQRTTNNYASLVARRLGLALVDASCGGATTASLLQAWDELPAQLDAVTADTALVTLTVGGNDLGYMGVLFAGSCRAGVASREGECPPVAAPTEAQYAALEASLTEVVREIHRRAPTATVVFVQYLSAVPDGPCDRTAITPEAARIGRDLARRLAQVTARVATAQGAKLLPADELSKAHTACGRQPWSHGFYKGYDTSLGVPWHPAPEGHVAVAEALVELLAR